jgi:cyclic pyranopterin phosphate synthase
MNVSDGGGLAGARLPQFRVALNARCGRACFFCRPSGEAVATAAGAEVAVDDLVAVARAVRQSGVRGIKLTGGDPALYGPLEEAVLRLWREAQFSDIEVISRHPRIGARAAGLASSGVTLFNISVDTLDPVLHQDLCGVDDLPEVLDALDQCLATGVPCKVNMVVMRGVNDDEVATLVAYCAERDVQALKLLDVIRDLDEGQESYARRLAVRRGKSLRQLYQPFDDLAAALRVSAVSEEIRQQGGLGHPMTVFTLPSGLEVILKDGRAGGWYSSVCNDCPLFPCHDALMALRLTADLRLQFCLLREDITVPLRHLDGAAREEAVREALNSYGEAVFLKTADLPVRSLGALQV